jgi:hypothetical protein
VTPKKASIDSGEPAATLDDQVSEKKRLCFVIGPIGDVGSRTRRRSDWLLKRIIEPVFAEHFSDFLVERADTICTPGSIISQIIKRLHSAELVIADLSDNNPNAYYEIGIRHMNRLPTIHMYMSGRDIPFDVKVYRAIPFAYKKPQDLQLTQIALNAAVSEAISPGFRVDNPVTDARELEESNNRTSESQKSILEALQTLRTRIDRLDPTEQRLYVQVWLKEKVEPSASAQILAALDADLIGFKNTGLCINGNPLFTMHGNLTNLRVVEKVNRTSNSPYRLEVFEN